MSLLPSWISPGATLCVNTFWSVSYECMIHTVTQGGNVSQCVIKSISGMNTFTSQVSVQSFCVALSCAYDQIVKTTGTHYTITISSVNDGGVGSESDPVQGTSPVMLVSQFSIKFIVTQITM